MFGCFNLNYKIIIILSKNCTARLLNAIVSTKAGRNYIGDHSIINYLVWGENLFLQSFKFTDREFIECHTSDMLIAAMMKLGMENWQKKDMIRKGKFFFIIIKVMSEASQGSHLSP